MGWTDEETITPVYPIILCKERNIRPTVKILGESYAAILSHIPAETRAPMADVVDEMLCDPGNVIPSNVRGDALKLSTKLDADEQQAFKALRDVVDNYHGHISLINDFRKNAKETNAKYGLNPQSKFKLTL